MNKSSEAKQGGVYGKETKKNIPWQMSKHNHNCTIFPCWKFSSSGIGKIQKPQKYAACIVVSPAIHPIGFVKEKKKTQSDLDWARGEN